MRNYKQLNPTYKENSHLRDTWVPGTEYQPTILNNSSNNNDNNKWWCKLPPEKGENNDKILSINISKFEKKLKIPFF